MSRQRRLEELLELPSWSDDQVAEIASMRTIRHLDLPEGIGLPRGALRKLAAIPSLQTLELRHNIVSIGDVRAIATMPSLWRVDLQGTPLTAAMVRLLARAPKLRELWVADSGIGNDDLRVIAAMPLLEWLILDDNRITDDGLRHLAAASSLRTLWLCGTDVTDAGLQALAPLQRLTAVNITRSRITAKGKDALFAAQQELRKSARRRTPAARDEQEIAAATEALTGFLREMDKWNAETARTLDRSTSRKLERERAAAKIAIFERWCTKRKRVYDDPAQLTWSSGRKRPVREIVDADQPDPRRIEITLRTEHSRLLYVLLRRRDGWRIDHCKMWMNGGWSDYSLNLH